MRHHNIEHQFVKYIPDALEPGVLYISLEYATAVHNCFCGCGERVVTPFSPNDWKMTFDGETISIWPSIGSWSLACRSHYVIDHGQVILAGQWSEEQIHAERLRDRAAKARHYATTCSNDPVMIPVAKMAAAKEPIEIGFWRRVWRRLVGRST